MAMMSIPLKLKPMLATLVDQPFDNPQWIYEIKWDGYRAIAEIDHGKIELYSRNLQSFNQKYPAVVAALRKFNYRAVLDGEVVVLDDSGKSNFQWLQNYNLEPHGQLRYYVFDLLYLNGKDLQPKPLKERKILLKKILPASPIIKYSDHIIGQGIKFFEQAIKQGLEGVIAKNGQSTYQIGRRSDQWLKIKTHKRQEAVIAGFTEPRSSRKYFGALVLGVYNDQGQLVYVGHTGTGINHQGLQYIYGQLRPLIQKQSPFATTPKTNMPATWVKPKLVCEVKFTEWTEHGQMRHPSFQGLREDKPPRQIKREKEKSITAIV
jgi:bifunctional non-homologous end joining protein LigD